MPDERYPIGKFQFPEHPTSQQRDELIRHIESLPSLLRDAVRGLSPEQTAQPYREGGWTVRQVVHHIADSHMNAYVRFKLAITEETPMVKPYNESAWAQLVDAVSGDVENSLNLIESLHHRWVLFLRGLPQEAFQRAFQHPERGLMTLDTTLALYAWHGRHHTAHITELRKRMQW
jgi:uncharacterized damage-inducible protein DinB